MESKWSYWPVYSHDIRHPDYWGRPATYASEYQAIRVSESIKKRYSFYETNILQLAHGNRPWRVQYRKVDGK